MQLTLEYIQSLPDGNALDLLVNEHVFQCKRFNINAGKMNLLAPADAVETWRAIWPDLADGWADGVVDCASEYGHSLSLDAAWRVAERMNELDDAGEAGAWWWNFWQSGMQQPPIWKLSSKKAAVAICQAAVIACLPQPSYAEAFEKLGKYFEGANWSHLEKD